MKCRIKTRKWEKTQKYPFIEKNHACISKFDQNMQKYALSNYNKLFYVCLTCVEGLKSPKIDE